MAIRKIRLTEAELTRLIGRIVEETEAEMEEGWLGDKYRDLKRYTTGYGDESEKSEAEEAFFNELDEVESEVLENIEDFRYGTVENWEKFKPKLISQARDNDFLGELEIQQARRTGKQFVIYVDGHSKGGEKLRDIASTLGASRRSYQSKGRG
jgi:hypothetical protein